MNLADELVSIVRGATEFSYDEIAGLLKGVARKGERELYLHDKYLPHTVERKLKSEGVSVLDKSDESDGYYYFVSF